MGRGEWHGRRNTRARRNTFSAQGFRKKFEEAHYARGGTRQDPLNLNHIDEAEEEPEVHSEPEEPNFFPKNLRDPLGLKNKPKKEKEKKKRGRERSRSNSPIPAKVAKTKTSESTQDDAETGATSKESLQEVKQSKKEVFNKRYRYGNFDRYYGTRLEPGGKDPRLQLFKKEWFHRKSVLDIGCNVGFLTLTIAKDYEPRRILGIDIDEHLVGVARKNIRHYCDHDIQIQGKYPASFANEFGTISVVRSTFNTKFPDNVWFRRDNYVFESDDLLEVVEEEFDVILALSVTKWIHLNWGDDGMRRFFQRAFKQLRPGGRFILEPQPYSSYRKRAKMTPELLNNYQHIEFKPSDFEMYLIEIVGFESVEHMGCAAARSKGFEREVDVYVKSEAKSKPPEPAQPTPPAAAAAAEAAPSTVSPVEHATETPSWGTEANSVSHAELVSPLTDASQ